jgi:hypothetical protein
MAEPHKANCDHWTECKNKEAFHILKVYKSSQNPFVAGIKTALFGALLYPLARTEAFMQSHHTYLTPGNKLPGFVESFKMLPSNGGYYRGAAPFIIYYTGISFFFNVNPLLGVASVGFLYPLEVAYALLASNAGNAPAFQSITSGYLQKRYWSGLSLHYLAKIFPFFTMINNIKRNYILSQFDEGVSKKNFSDLYLQMKANGGVWTGLFRGFVPFAIIYVTSLGQLA